MQAYEDKHYEQVRAIASECMVLLKSNGDFPLQYAGEIALYGNAGRRTIKGGTGSGDVNVRHFVTVEEGLEKAGFTITTKRWLDGYDAVWNAANKKFKEQIKAKIAKKGLSAIMLSIGAIMPEPEYDLPLTGKGDTAIYVLGRISGEGSDRSAAPGDFELTCTEIRDILRLQRQYRHFLLALNVGGVVDLSPVLREVSNILLLSQTGMAIGDAFADILLGKAYPSGKLASTWASWKDYCHIGDFAERNDTRYKEGIYVGYRYFDSVQKQPHFPFGYGLGYTRFQIQPISATITGSCVHITVAVTNIGSRPGKEVVQLYVSIPSVTLDQPYQMLTAFQKTEELVPGECCILCLSFAMEDISSFDTTRSCTVLESGQYVLRIGNSSRETTVCAVVKVEEEILVQQLAHTAEGADFEDWKPEVDWRENSYGIPVLHLNASDIDITKAKQYNTQTSANAVGFAKKLTDSELAYLCVGAFRNTGDKSVIGNAGVQVAGAAGETTSVLVNMGIPSLIMADGPAGLRLSRRYFVDETGAHSLDNGNLGEVRDLLPEPMWALLGLDKQTPKNIGMQYNQYCTAIPVGTALAQSWSIKVCEACGDIVGNEMERFGVHLWLAPALNLHRFPLCGRNFEYFSEDPLISGKMAAAITRGVQHHPGCGVTIKHFCCNNQETNRMHSNSVVSERALRDLYLRAFQIAIQESQPAAVMSSYNLLNGEHTSQRRDLLEVVLRKEWGFSGIVMSDWVAGNVNDPENHYPGIFAPAMIKAGNDIIMPGSSSDYEALLEALRNSDTAHSISRVELERCATRLIACAINLGQSHSKLIRESCEK